MFSLKRDFLDALSQIRRHRAHSAVVVLTLSLGLGANTAVFSVVDAVLYRALPVADPSALALFQWTSGPNPAVDYLTGEWRQDARTGRLTAASFSYPAFDAFRQRGETLSSVFAWSELRRPSLSMDGAAELVSGQLVSGGYYRGLGVPALLGRTITPQDDRAGAQIVAVISHGYWQRRFGGARDAIGRVGTLDGRSFRIVGVSPRSFAGTLPVGRSADVSVPILAWHASGGPYVSNPAWHWLQVMGRIQPGRTPAQAQEEMAPRLATVVGARAGESPRLRLRDGSRGLTQAREERRQPLAALAAAAALVLLMTCASVAGLLLARGATRRRELGVRLALGASRRAIIRMLVVEGAVLAALSGLAAVVLAFWTKDALAASLLRAGAPRVALDGRALAFLAAISMATALLASLAPALRTTRIDVSRDLHEGGRTALPFGLGRLLVVAQVAVSLVTLVGAGLFLRTLRNLVGIETGVAVEGVFLFKVHAIAAGEAESLGLSRSLLERLREVPGVRAVGVSTHQLVGDLTDRTRVSIEGRAPVRPGDSAHVNRVGGAFFDVLGIRIRAGRPIDARDEAGTAPVMVVNEAFARDYFRGENPLGRRVNGATVVGVSADTLYGALRDPPPPTMFVPAFQQATGSFSFQVRTLSSRERLEPLLRQAVREVAPSAALYELTTPWQQVERAASQERLLAGLNSAFGALALSLASVGLYGLLAFAVRQRRHEIGVRMALGAGPGDILRMTLGSGMSVVVIGAFLGIPCAMALAGLARNLLYGVTPSDPSTAAAAVMLLFCVALVACWVPARRAARVDPTVALRSE